jgi:hypothetical protein
MQWNEDSSAIHGQSNGKDCTVFSLLRFSHDDEGVVSTNSRVAYIVS